MLEKKQIIKCMSCGRIFKVVCSKCGDKYGEYRLITSLQLLNYKCPYCKSDELIL